MAELPEDKKRAVELLCSRPDLSKEKIAEEVGVTRQTLNRWEKEPTFRHEMRAMGREPIPPADVREILAVLIAQAKAKDVAAYLADPVVTRDGLLKELRSVLPEETLALLPTPEEAEETRTLPRHEPNMMRLLSPNLKTASGEAGHAGVLTHTGETGVIYIQGPKETEAMFWDRVNKNEMFESMRQ